MLINKLKKIEILKTIYYTFLSRNIKKEKENLSLFVLRKVIFS